MLSLNLEGKVVIITGASGGLGIAVTKAFLDAGARVVGVDRVPRSKSPDHPSLTHVAVALEDFAAVEQLVNDTVLLHGRIDAAVHLVGGFAGGLRIEETTEEVWDKMFAVNLRPAIHLARAVLPVMRAAKRGAFLAIGSPAAIDPAPSVGAYAAAKAGLISLIKTIAVENRDARVRANIVAPGTMDTHANRTAMPDYDSTRWVQPSNVASLLVWLASDAGAEITGAVLPLPGRE
jgi:NAD(P)-dependent dehydrogenase (short-subunit alcohol dehydrogenase family)